MSDKNQEFWKELMGDEFKVELDSDGAPETKVPPPVTPPPDDTPKGAPDSADEPFIDSSGEAVSSGFTIEYISRDAPPSVSARSGGPRPTVEGPRIQRPIGPGQTNTPRPAGCGQTPGIQRPIGPGNTPSAQGSARTGQSPRIQRPIGPANTPSAQGPAQTGQSPRIQRPIGPEGQPSPARPQSARQPVRQPQGQPVNRRPAASDGSSPVRPAAESTPPQGRSGRRRTKDDGFEVEFDFDSEYADVDEKAVRWGRTKRTGCLSGILMFLFVICVSAVLASVGWIWATDVLGLDGEDVPVEVTLPEDFFHTEERTGKNDDGEEVTEEVTVADMDKVAEELYQKDLIKYKWLFKLFSKVSDADEKLRAGTYTLNMVYDYRALVHGMMGSRGSRDTTTVVIPEGYSITQIVELLSDSGVCGAQELMDALKDTDFDYPFLKDADVPPLGEPKRLEGFLFPDTYEFYVGDDPENVIRKFLNNFETKWTEDFDALAGELGYSRREVLIIASMIEKEAGNDSERDLISSVIHNRLSHPDRQGTNGYLQIDASIYYVTADTGEEFSTELDSPYNTYTNPGLPIGPIANPGVASIRAALQPKDTNYYYYALGANKSHQFFETYSEFTAFVNSDKYGGNN